MNLKLQVAFQPIRWCPYDASRQTFKQTRLISGQISAQENVHQTNKLTVLSKPPDSWLLTALHSRSVYTINAYIRYLHLSWPDSYGLSFTGQSFYVGQIKKQMSGDFEITQRTRKHRPRHKFTWWSDINMWGFHQLPQSRQTSEIGCEEQVLMFKPGGRKCTTGAGGIELSGFIYSSDSSQCRNQDWSSFHLSRAQRAPQLGNYFSRNKKNPTGRVKRAAVAISCYDLVCQEIKAALL